MNGDRLELTDLVEIRDLLFRTQAVRFRVSGWSMYPTLWSGDRLTAELVSPADLRVGDLLLIDHCGRVICHRLVARQDTGSGPRLVTKGDGQGGRGDTIRAEHVLGRVVAVRRRWSWARRGGWPGSLAMRLDRARAWLTDRIARNLGHLQSVRGYRIIMRILLLPGVGFYLGVSEGQRWFRYRRTGGRDAPGAEVAHRACHLVAKRAGRWAGSVRVTPTGNGHRVDQLYVRLRYRGMGVGSRLVALAAVAAGADGPTVVLAAVEPENTVALDVFTKSGFRQTDRDANAICLRRDVRG